MELAEAGPNSGGTLTTETLMTEEQPIRQATDVLIDNLGIMEAARFLAIKRQGRLESVERHRLWQMPGRKALPSLQGCAMISAPDRRQIGYQENTTCLI
jgi:hypothetical protein